MGNYYSKITTIHDNNIFNFTKNSAIMKNSAVYTLIDDKLLMKIHEKFNENNIEAKLLKTKKIQTKI